MGSAQRNALWLLESHRGPRSHEGAATRFQCPEIFSREFTMKRSILVLLSLLALVLAGPVACKKKAKADERLNGAWIIDADATIAQLPEDQQAVAGAFIRLMKIGMIFDGEGKLEMSVSMMGEQETQDGTYKIISIEDDVFTVEMTRAAEEGAEGEEESSQMIVTFVTPDQIRFAPVPEEGDTPESLQRDTLYLKRTTPEALKAEMDAPTEQPSLEQLFGGEMNLEGLQGLEGLDVDQLEVEGDAAEGDAVEGDAPEAGADGQAEADAAADVDADEAPEADAAE